MICHEKGKVMALIVFFLVTGTTAHACVPTSQVVFVSYFSVPCETCAATAHTVWFLPTPHICDGLNSTWCADDRQNDNNVSKCLVCCYFCCSALMLLKP